MGLYVCEGVLTMRVICSSSAVPTLSRDDKHQTLSCTTGFTITTDFGRSTTRMDVRSTTEIMAQAMEGVKKMEEINGKKFGDLKNPLLVSVRSGARASMPGMMDSILNLGLNDDVVAAMIAGNPDPAFERFVYDSYRRFIQMFSDVVMKLKEVF